MNKKRLLKLADLLEADAKNKKGVKFDLADWAVRSGAASEDNRHFDNENDAVPVGCNTSACAIGLACISKAFNRQGLAYRLTPDWRTDGFVLVPTFAGHSHFGAVERFFDIEETAAHFLFLQDKYPKEKRKGAVGERYVAKRIRDFVAGKAKAA